MGQPVVVVEKPSSKPGVVRFEINRSLTGMGHERYRSVADATGDRPPDVLARRLFEHGGVAAVHVYSNMITVELTGDGTTEGLKEMIEELFIHYREGVQPSLP
ncbi:MAG: NifU N-terminal domain-containing protein [Actinomycetota bacterium]|nr:NifU N-terminal domain-containing protein [Actinomycetota bacterium]